MAARHIGLQAPTLLSFYAMRTIFLLLIIPPANAVWFAYRGFEYGNVKLEGDASILRSHIELTMNARDQTNAYSVGRVTSFEKMQLWDRSSGQLTDFTTKFSFAIFSNETAFGDGLAFFLADPTLPLSKHIKEGGGLGLVDGNQVLNSTDHSFVAVEFDTYQNPWDPTSTHVGINFNSMRSNITAKWFINIRKKEIYSCSIDYNSSTLNLSVSFNGYRFDGTPVENFVSYKVDLRDYLPECVTFGFSAATGVVFEVNTLQSWSFSSSLQSNKNVSNQIPSPAASPAPNPSTSPIPNPNLSPIPNPNPSPKNERNIGLLARLGIGIGVTLSFLGLVCIVIWKKTRGESEESVFDLNMDDEFQKGTGAKRFRYNKLMVATNNFAEAQKLGQGGFGGVYKGFLKDLNCYVAIKRISKESRQGTKEYATEVKIISQLRHRNLVQLIGWCHKKSDLLLIYEYMPNGSLDSHLYHGKIFLTWSLRYSIALGLASALLYLHEEWQQCVLHRDIKSSNIMLDSNFNAKLGDFGLARLVEHEKGSQTTTIAGTMGYIAPEYVTTGKANKESDIYSFGVVLLEIASGRKPIDCNAKEGHINIVEWVWELYGLGKFLEAADPKLCGTVDEKQMERLLVAGLWCVYPDNSFRPSVRQVIKVLNFEAPLPILPQKIPGPTYLPQTISAIFYSVSSPCLVTCSK